MLFILIVAVWLTFTIFAFLNYHPWLASTLLILGIVALILIFLFGIGPFGVAFLGVLAIIGMIRFKVDTALR